MKYAFSCRDCGKYSVVKETFFNFLTPALRHKVKKQNEKGEAVLEFQDSCPQCQPQG